MQIVLEDLLDQTRAALLQGDLAALAALGPQVEVVAESLGAADAATADRIRRKAQRNLTLLEASKSGLRAAQARLGDIFAAPTLTTYDAAGRKAAIPLVSAALPRRC